MVETAAEQLERAIPADFELFRRRSYRLTGLDLTSYKAPQMFRRLSALLTRLGVRSFDEYARVLQTNAARRQEFRDYVTINVSEFFRDVDRFSDLERRVLPELLSRGASLRVWSAGCSNGAEPYSLSLLLQELGPDRAHSILATDIDQTILDRARTASGYMVGDLRNVGPTRIRRWFVPTNDGHFDVTPAARALIRFARHDLLRDAFPSGPFDLIACRNVVIYFTEGARERILENFVSVLRSGGVLFLGGSEAVMRPQALGLTVMAPGFYRKMREGD
jgi:chemotaxis protein methyltransferase CheR